VDEDVHRSAYVVCLGHCGYRHRHDLLSQTSCLEGRLFTFNKSNSPSQQSKVVSVCNFSHRRTCLYVTCHLISRQLPDSEYAENATFSHKITAAVWTSKPYIVAALWRRRSRERRQVCSVHRASRVSGRNRPWRVVKLRAPDGPSEHARYYARSPLSASAYSIAM